MLSVPKLSVFIDGTDESWGDFNANERKIEPRVMISHSLLFSSPLLLSLPLRSFSLLIYAICFSFLAYS
jgi:hypothetical protein